MQINEHLKRHILKVLEQKRRRPDWTHIFWAIDLHDTIITGKYNRNNEGATVYPYAQFCLAHLLQCQEHKSILWTSSHPDAIKGALERFDLAFHYINQNPDCPNTELCDFSHKFYFNVLLDDKAGFNGEEDWFTIYHLIQRGLIK